MVGSRVIGRIKSYESLKQYFYVVLGVARPDAGGFEYQ
jgi:hypothetical protein